MKKELTWQDIKRIVNIADEIMTETDNGDIPECCMSEEAYYTEVLNRYENEKRGI